MEAEVSAVTVGANVRKTVGREDDKEERESVGRRRIKEGEELGKEGKEMVDGRKQQKDEQTHR